MFKTVFLSDEGDYHKTFNSRNVKSLTEKKFNNAQRFRLINDISQKSFGCQNFYFSDGSVYLKDVNQIYCIEHLADKTDLVLPKDPKMFDWVLLYYDQTNVVFDVSNENRAKIKLYGNGNRIMGFDEPLHCDMEFLSLRLTFIDLIEGWVIV